MNLLKCRRCGKDVLAGAHATNKRFCSHDCYETWWKERQADYQRMWRARNPESNRASLDRYRARYPERVRESRLRAHGLTLGQYEAMGVAQGGLCAICHGPPNHGQARLDVDHDHKTRMVRALLCRACNLTLGKMGEDPHLLRLAAEYLERHMLRSREGTTHS